MIYRVHFNTTDGSKGYGFYSSKIKAKKAIADFAKEWKEEYGEGEIIEKIPNPRGIKQWIKLINRIASHNDNG